MIHTINLKKITRNMGGMVIRGRVSGSLAVTRALGDLELKTEVRIIRETWEDESYLFYKGVLN